MQFSISKKIRYIKLSIYTRGGQTVAREPHAALYKVMTFTHLVKTLEKLKNYTENGE